MMKTPKRILDPKQLIGGVTYTRVGINIYGTIIRSNYRALGRPFLEPLRGLRRRPIEYSIFTIDGQPRQFLWSNLSMKFVELYVGSRPRPSFLSDMLLHNHTFRHNTKTERWLDDLCADKRKLWSMLNGFQPDDAEWDLICFRYEDSAARERTLLDQMLYLRNPNPRLERGALTMCLDKPRKAISPVAFGILFGQFSIF